MIKILLYYFLFLHLISSAFSDVIKNTTHFKLIGSIDSFQWAPDRYENDFRYDIFYYIPETLKSRNQVSGLIFNHGGGSSTMDRDGSLRAVSKYMPDLKRMADELGIVVVLPSANGLNWGGHTRGLVRDLARMMRLELDLDPNRLGLAGHSMGGMGITRNYLWGADEFAFYLPLSSGMDENHQSEQHLNKVFNVPYVHLQGMHDHFDIFITRCLEQVKRTKELELKYGVPSKLQMYFYDGPHNYNFDLFKSTLSKLLKESPRNLYQKELWGSLHTVKTKNVENNITYDYDSEARYFWAELSKSNLSAPERVDFHAKIDGQTILVEMPVLPVQSKSLKLYLHSSMIDLLKPIEVSLNGMIVVTRIPQKGVAQNMDFLDPGFVFEDTIEIDL